MSAPTATGNNAPNQHPTEISFDPRRGMSYRQRFTCGKLTATAASELLTLLVSAQGLGGSGKLVLSNVMPDLSFELPGVPSGISGVSEIFFDEWNMPQDDLTNSIFANPYIAANINYNDRIVLQRYAKLGSGTTIETVITNLNADVTAGVIVGPTTAEGGTSSNLFQAPTAGIPLELFKMIDNDQTEFLQPLPVLQHTSVCSPGSTYNNTRNNEMRIYSPAQLLTEVGSGWTLNLPGSLYSQISSFPALSAASDESAYYTWGWLKQRMIQSTTTNFMVQRHVEYKLNLWSNIDYQLHP